MAKSVDHAIMREMNMALILKTLSKHAPISRAGLASSTGLNKASVSSMVRDLLDRGIIMELSSSGETSDVGRPGINLQLNPEAGYVLSAEIGVGFLLVIAADFSLDVVVRDRRDTTDLDTPEAVLDSLTTMLRRALSQLNRRNRRVFGIAVGAAGLVDMLSGTLLFAPNMTWNDVPIRQILAAHFDLPIYVANEANMAAAGESYIHEEQAGYLLYVSSGIGLGGGIVLNGEVLTGISGFAGEIGHMSVDPQGRRCRCGGYGCWETVASQQALFRTITERMAAGAPTMLNGQKPERLTVQNIVDAADAGDEMVIDALRDLGRWLGIGIANVVNIINPQRVVIGGPMAVAQRYLLPVIEATVQERGFPRLRDTVEITISTYLTDATVMGGVAMIHKQVLNHPMDWMLQDA
jgi:glucokinase-like ROK family protein